MSNSSKYLYLLTSLLSNRISSVVRPLFRPSRTFEDTAPTARPTPCVSAMPVEEFIVSNVQWLLPTWFLRLLVRLYLRYSGGPALRGGDVVIKQIHVDGRLTEASASLPSSTPCRRQNTRRATLSLGQPRPVGRCPGWPALPGVAFRTGGHGRAERGARDGDDGGGERAALRQ